MIKKVEYLIVGQGIAGCCFAHKLLKEKKSFLVIDQGTQNSASRAAAGIVNPVALKRLILGWRANDFLHYNTSFYKEIASLLGKGYCSSLPIHKLISSEEDLLFWKNRSKQVELSTYLTEKLLSPEAAYLHKSILKIAEVKQAYRVNVAALLKDFRAFLINNHLLEETAFKADDMSAPYIFRNYRFDHLVFCEGAKGIKNPFFPKLPFGLNKGQIITINNTTISEESILKKQVFVMPSYKPFHFKVGATFSWAWENDLPEKDKTLIIKEKLSQMLSVDFSIVKEEAGIRPATRDRRPFLGESSIQKNYFIFNGLGSKGCLMAPLLAEELFNHIEYGEKLNKEADIKRFYKPNH